jgi:hypothetical protein
MPSLNESYRNEDKKHFGSYVAFNEIKSLFYSNIFIRTNQTSPFDKEWEQIKSSTAAYEHSMYVLITKNLILTSDAAEAMSDFVREGNDLFISADYIDPQIEARFSFTTERDDEIVREVNGWMQETSVKMPASTNYRYYYYPFLNSFTYSDSSQKQILGFNDIGKPNYLVIFYGKGRLYVHTAPRAFSNYFMLSNDNYKYLEEVFSYTRPPNRNVYWDEYYNSSLFSRRKSRSGGNGSNFSSFSVIENNPALKWAFWLTFITALLYILFNIKRKQRIIPIRQPNINTTKVFAETVGRLYLEKKNNKNIAEKMITYFYEQVRNKYFINTNKINDEFIGSLSGKSGMGHEETKQLLTRIEKAQSSPDLSDAELLLLNEQIQNFNNHIK